MKIIEILNLHKETFRILKEAGVRIEDTEYISLYDDYRRMLGNGEKVSYIVASLAARYNMSERKVYTLIKRFQTECSPGAA